MRLIDLGVICALGVAEDLLALLMEPLAQLGGFVVMMQGFDSLLEADGDDEADDDGGDVDEEVAPGVGGGVGWVDVEHGVS
jgi:hypothetical protein